MDLSNFSLRYAERDANRQSQLVIDAVQLPLWGVAAWLGALRQLELQVSEVDIYGLAQEHACLIVWHSSANPNIDALQVLAKAYTWATPQMLIPVLASIHPPPTQAEQHAFGSKGECYLWTVGNAPVLLGRPLEWTAVLMLPPETTARVQTPAYPVRVPMRLGAVSVAPPPSVAELLDVRDELEIAPDMRPLSTTERIRLKALEQLLGGQGTSDRKGNLRERLANALAGGNDAHHELERLRQREGDEFERLQRLYETDPVAALRYSPPLDTINTAGGSDVADAAYRFRQYWQRTNLDASISGGRGSRGGNTYEERRFEQLRELYDNSIARLTKEERFEEAAFTMLKLKNDAAAAAAYMREHGLYGKAADLYLRHLKQEVSAAKCYQEGRFYREALELYRRNDALEEAGDCANSLGKSTEANELYRQRSAQLVAAGDPLRASKLLRDKVYDKVEAQLVLDAAIRTGVRAHGCLRNYLSHEPEPAQQLGYLDDLSKSLPEEYDLLLSGIIYLHNEHPSLAAQLSALALPIVARGSAKEPKLLRKLTRLMNDKEFGVDVEAYLASHRGG